MLGSEIRFPLQQQRENRFGSPFVVDADMPGACPRDLKAPLSGAGGVNNGSRPSLALCASVSPVFRSREARVAKERRIARFSFLFFGGGNGIRRPRPQGALFRGRGCRQRIAAVTRAMCESRFPLQKKGKNLATLPFLFCLYGTGACAVSGFRMPIQARCSRLYCRPAGDLS